MPDSAVADPAVNPSSLSKSYAAASSSFDELMALPGVVRPQWTTFMKDLETIGLPEITRRWEAAARLMQQQGMTYNVYGDPQGMERPWQLDPIPFIIDGEEWKQIGDALIQRATLLNLILRDLYGPQKLLREGFFPPALVLGHPNFLRPCVGVPVAEDTYLHLYAADLARSPDGQWWVVNDRTQSPSGAGYALENRMVVLRMLSEAFRDCDVKRLHSFFIMLRETIERQAPHGKDNPRVVLLTPGPYNETYYEHVYLARYLGYTLVEGGDLTVRDNRVYLKALGGLQQVDVILRRLDEDFCDPLELRSDSTLGVAGLLQAVAAGHVAVVNALGSGLIEIPALRAFLNPLCRHLLGEDLKMPSVATWWCGQKKAFEYVCDHLDDLTVRPTFGPERAGPFIRSTLSREEKTELIQRMRFRPHDFTGHEQIAMSSAPALVNGKLESRPVVVRVFLVARNGSYHVLPGGLTRVAASPDQGMVSMQRGDGSKDTWILGGCSEEETAVARAQLARLELRRGGNDLASRVADNLFWLGRYTERCDASVRLLRTVLQNLSDESALRSSPCLGQLISAPQTMGLITAPSRDLTDADELARLQQDVMTSVFAKDNPGGLRDTMGRVHWIASSLRDRISPDVWRILNYLVHEALPAGASASFQPGEGIVLLNNIVTILAAFGGMEMENMVRGPGWRFLDIGRRLERSLFLVRLLRSTVTQAQEEESSLHEALLDIGDSTMTYRSRYFGTAHLTGVLDLLLTDEDNPRSLAFQLAEILHHMDYLPHEPEDVLPSQAKKIVLGGLANVRLADLDSLSIANPYDENRRTNLVQLLDSIGRSLPQFSDQLTLRYFSHAATARELNALGMQIQSQ
ncbi:MAG: hypothetical protein B9S32_01510 [Verrucomicrobia bacterium Tous-C9LFEB]|nr:MAG: hypothetical protein B9S32_01510 [Verrucomicrobia bacterium Tous-C9LFEB]